MTALYDSIEGIQEYLKDGLAGFHHLIRDRAKASEGDDLSKRLDTFYIHGRWVLDTFGQVRVILDDYPGVFPLVARDIWDFLPKGASLRESFSARPPLAEDKCPLCGIGWTLEDAHKAHFDRDLELYKHRECLLLERNQKTLEEFQKAFAEADPLASYDFKPIPNEYDNWELSTSWYEVRSLRYRGFLKIGWRKRVISLDWLDNGAQVLVTTDDVTKGPYCVHAWGYAKLTEYLKSLLLRLNRA